MVNFDKATGASGTVRLVVNYTQNAAANTTTYTATAQIEHRDPATWTSGVGWSVNVAGSTASGAVAIPSGGGWTTVGSWSQTRSHDANGYIGAQGFSFTMNATGTYGLGGPATASGTVAAPRIAKVPPAPTPIGLDQITHNTMRYRFTGTDNGGSAILRWEYQCGTVSNFSGVGIATSSGTTVRSDLAPGTTYYWRARGVNAVGNGPWSSISTAKTWGVPSAPGTPSVGTPTTSSVPLSWSAPSSDGGAPVTKYEVQRATNSGFTSGTATATFTGRSGNMGSLSSGTKYWFRVRALNAAGAGPWSGTRETATLPGAPTALVPTQLTPSSFRVNWTAPVGNAILFYQAEPSDRSDFTGGDPGDDPWQEPTTTSVTFSAIQPGVRQYVRVRAVTAGGVGAWSSTLSFTPGLPAPGTPTAATETTGYRLRVNWTAPSVTTGLTGYRVLVSSKSDFSKDVTTVDVGKVLTTDITVTGGRLLYVKVAALTAGGVNTYSGVRSVVHRLNAGNIDGWARFGAKPAAIEYYTSSGLRRGTVNGKQALWVESLSTGSASMATRLLGISKTVKNLKIGKAYRFQARATLGSGALHNQYRLVVTSASGVVATVSTNTDLGFVEFVASATSHEIRLEFEGALSVSGAQPVVESIAYHDIKLLELVTDYDQRLRETVFESTLANHLDMACNSVGASWYVDVAGDTRFRLPGASLPLSYTFSDSDHQGALHYVDATTAYDTRSLTNRLEVTNMGVDAARVNEQNDTVIVNSETSQALYGTRTTTLTTNIYNVAPYANALTSRLAEVLDAADDAALLISSIRWNAQEDLSVARGLEVGQRILVHFNGQEQDSQIVSITHEVTPTRWIVTLNLQRLA